MKSIIFSIVAIFAIVITQNAFAQPAPSVAELSRKADAGDKQAQEDLGRIYAFGTGVPVDYVLAHKYFLLAAAQDMTKSQHNLCYLYGAGNGVAKNLDTAISWCEKSANKGFLKSQILLGDFYLEKGMTTANVTAARNWYLKAAAQNDAYSQYMAAQTYFHVPVEMRDYEIGLNWAKKSAAQNFPDGIKLKGELEAAITAASNPLPASPVVAQVQPNPPSEPIDKKAKAIADFNDVTIPNILAIAPYISKNAVERNRAFPNIERISLGCSNAGSSGYDGEEALARKTAYFCGALVSYMENAYAQTCDKLSMVNFAEALTKNNNSGIISSFETKGILKLEAELNAATKCKEKSKDFWAQEIIKSYVGIDGILLMKANTYEVANPKSVLWLTSECMSAGSLVGLGGTGVSGSAFFGCAALKNMAKNDGTTVCQLWTYAKSALSQSNANDVNANYIDLLNTSYTRMWRVSGCEAKANALIAAEQAKKDQLNRGELNDAISGFNGAVAIREAHLAEWEGVSNGEYYKKLVKDMSAFPSLAQKILDIDCSYAGRIYESQIKVVQYSKWILRLQQTQKNLDDNRQEELYLDALKGRQTQACDY